MKVFINSDLEGVAGVVSFPDQAYSDGKHHEHAKRLLTDEVNAAVTGLLEAGAQDVVVLDGHGPGGVCFERIHPSVKLIHGRPLALSWRDELSGCAAAIFVGQHAMAGSAHATLNHTQNSRANDHIKLNGRLIGEIGQFALLCGSHDVPVLFLSGDEAACVEVEALIPGVVTAAVKRGLSRTSAISVSAPAAHNMIREATRRAMLQHREKPIEPLRWDPPYVLEKRYFTTDLVERYREVKNARLIDSQTVQLTSDSIRDILYA